MFADDWRSVHFIASRGMPNMKLKERVFLVLFLSVSCLFLFKYKLEKKQITSDYYEEASHDQSNTYLDGDHSHRKRETHLQDQKVNQKNDINHNKNENKLSKIGNLLENDRGAKGIKYESSETGENDKAHGLDPWDIWWTMVTDRHVTSPDGDKQIERILQALATRSILTAKTFSRGTQLKASLNLDGPSQQKVIFKPMR